MNVLLDTHTFIWFNLNDSRLTDAARATIQEPANTVLISPASYWEIAIKISRGKFLLTGAYEEFWRRGLDDNGIGILPIELRHAGRLVELPYHHSDPFDRMLVAQALVEQIPLVSADPRLDAYGSIGSPEFSGFEARHGGPFPGFA